jgi:hypothetical protein
LSGIVYEITHEASGRRYIGSTTMPLQKRWVGHCGPALRRNFALTPLQEAIRQHGPDAFTARILASARSVTDLRATEAAIIAQEGTRWPRGFNVDQMKGYRTTPYGRRGWRRSEPTVSAPLWRSRRSHAPIQLRS